MAIYQIKLLDRQIVAEGTNSIYEIGDRYG